MKHVFKRLAGLSCLVLGLLFITNFAVAQDKDKTTEPPKEDPIDPQQVADELKMKQIEAILAYTYETDGKDDGSSTETKDDQKGTATGGSSSETKGWGSLPARDIANILKVRAIEDILAGIAGDEGSGEMGFGDDERGKVAEEIKATYEEDPAAQAETFPEGNDKGEETKEDQKADTHGWGATDGKELTEEQRAEVLKQEAKEAEEKLNQIAESLSKDDGVKGYASPRRCNCSTMSCYIACIKKIVKVKPKKKIKYIRVKK
jgi:hypothetical protein